MERETLALKQKAAIQKKLERLGMRFAGILGVISPRKLPKESVMEVVLLGRREMDRIRRVVRLKAKRGHMTDVLAFPEPSPFTRKSKGLDFPHPDREGIFLGDIYLNEEIFMADPHRGITLFIHGFLHLVGYDHIQERDRIIMEKLEEKLLGVIANPPAFARHERAGTANQR